MVYLYGRPAVAWLLQYCRYVEVTAFVAGGRGVSSVH